MNDPYLDRKISERLRRNAERTCRLCSKITPHYTARICEECSRLVGDRPTKAAEIDADLDRWLGDR